MRNPAGSPDRMILDARVRVMHRGGNSGIGTATLTHVHKVRVCWDIIEGDDRVGALILCFSCSGTARRTENWSGFIWISSKRVMYTETSSTC
jgi:hypothetical protein